MSGVRPDQVIAAGLAVEGVTEVPWCGADTAAALVPQLRFVGRARVRMVGGGQFNALLGVDAEGRRYAVYWTRTADPDGGFVAVRV